MTNLIAQNLLTKILKVALVALVIAFSAVPQQVLAFEAALPTAVAQKLVAQVALANGVTTVATPPDYTERMGAVAQAYPSTEVEEAVWETERLALADERKRTQPKTDLPYVLEGEASFYSRDGCLGCNPLRIMANGQPLDDSALTMAIGANLKHLVGYRARVTNLATNQSVDVLITDTGGFYKAKYGNRVADLTIATKQAIGMYGGVGQVRVEVY